MTPHAPHLNAILSLYRLEKAPYSTLSLRDIEYLHWVVSHVVSGNMVTYSRGIQHVIEAGGSDKQQFISLLEAFAL